MLAMRTVALLLAGLLLPLTARADVVDLSNTERSRRMTIPTFALRAEGGSEYSPYGMFGGVASFFTGNALGGAEIEVGGGVGTSSDKGRGVQLGLALRQLFGEGGDYFAFELSIAANTAKELGYDPAAGHLQASRYWSSLGVGFEHREGFLSLSLVAALSFAASFDFVPHPMVHGGLGFAF